MNNCCTQTEGVTIAEKLEDIRDSIDVITAVHPFNEYQILERLGNKLTDILNELKQKGGG